MTADRALENLTSGDGEWANWVADWQSGAATVEAPRAEELRRRSRRYGLGLIALTASEVVFTILGLAYVLHWTWRQGTAVAVAICVAAIVFFALAWVYTVWNRRGTWRPAAHSTRAFIELELLRAQRKLRTLRSVPAFVGLELAVLLPLAVWRVWSHPERLETAPRVALHLGIFGVVLIITLVIVRRFARRTEREVEKLEELHRGLS